MAGARQAGGLAIDVSPGCSSPGVRDVCHMERPRRWSHRVMAAERFFG